MNTQVSRDQPITPDQAKQEIDDTFIFNPPQSAAHLASCQRIQNACKTLAQAIAEEVPDGKERTIAINNLLSAALFARQGITRRQIMFVVTAPPPPAATPVSTPPPSPLSSPVTPSPAPSPVAPKPTQS